MVRKKGPWKSVKAVELVTLEWFYWFNNHRLMEPLGYVPQAEFERDYWSRHTAQLQAA
jgi:putative transposase